MSIKEQLKEAVANSDSTPINEALQGMFESVELSDDVRVKFSTVFESLVKAKAIELAESYIDDAAAKADVLVQEHKAELDESAEEYGKYLAEQMEKKVDTYLDHVVEQWLEENRLALEGSLKVEMFDNLVGGLKEMFVENNIVVPEDAVDVVKELEEEIKDLEATADKAVMEAKEYKDKCRLYEKAEVIKAVTKGMTESQAEKITALAEGLDFTADFESRLTTIVEFASGAKLGVISEKEKKGEEESGEDADKGSETFKSDDESEKKDKDMKESAPNDPMSAYLEAAKKIR